MAFPADQLPDDWLDGVVESPDRRDTAKAVVTPKQAESETSTSVNQSETRVQQDGPTTSELAEPSESPEPEHIPVQSNSEEKTLQAPSCASTDPDSVNNPNESTATEETESEVVDSEFCWEDFFERTGAVPEGSDAFAHVDLSLKSETERYVKAGHWLDVPSMSKGPRNCYYWPAKVVLVCGRMLRLRWRTEINLQQEETTDSDSSKSPKTDRASLQTDNAEFWWDLASELSGRKIFPCRHLAPIPELCEENHFFYRPPPELQLEPGFKIRNLFCPLNKERTVDGRFNHTHQVIYTRFRVGDVLEIQGQVDPMKVYFANILKNVGGRLELELCEKEAAQKLAVEEKKFQGTFWEFYLSETLHPVGWCEFEGTKFGCKYAAYSEITIEKYIGNPLFNSPGKSLRKVPKDAFEDTHFIKQHSFEVGMRLEMLDMESRAQFFPATVTKVLNSFYFVVTQDVYHKTKPVENGETEGKLDARLDEVNGEGRSSCEKEKTEETDSEPGQEEVEPIRRTCHRGSEGIFPSWWCQRAGLRLSPPPGFPKDEEFSWPSYVRITGGKFTSEDLFDIPDSESICFKRGRKLELVHPEKPDRLCAASIARINRHILWIHLDYKPEMTYCTAMDCRSTDLFPCGWGASNNVEVERPVERTSSVWEEDVERVRKLKLSKEKRGDFYQTRTEDYMPSYWLPESGAQWSGRIFINANCFAGPLLNCEKLRAMPSIMGPGPMRLVLQTLLNNLLSSGFRPRDVLELVQPEISCSNPDREILTVKARFKSRRFTGPVEICKKPGQFGEWCRELLAVLDACPYLISWRKIDHGSPCPANCQEMSKLAFLAPHKALGAGKRSGKKIARRLRRPSILAGLHSGLGMSLAHVETNKERALRKRPARPVAVVEAARRPVTRGVKLPKFGANGPQEKSPPDEKKKEGTNGKKNLKVTTKNGNKRDLNENGEEKKKVVEVKVKPMGISKPVPILPQDSIVAHEKLMSGGYPIPNVKSNPNEWSVRELCDWLKRTDAASVVPKLEEEEVDGQALMLLTIEDCQKYLQLKFGPALKLCGIIRELKVIFLRDYCKTSTALNF